MTDAEALLAAYDDQLRGVAEVPGADHWERLGPVILASYRGGRGLITYRALQGYAGAELEELVVAALEHYTTDPEFKRVEWKTRGHDGVPELHDILLRHGFAQGESESIMVGRVEDLAVHVPLPNGVTLRRISEPDDVHKMVAMGEVAFGEPSPGMADALLARMALGNDDMELWVAEAHGAMVTAGRLEPVKDSDFAGIWGGSTLPEWRSQGIYRALTAERARSALQRGKTLINSDSTEYSRPILERYGFVKVSTTTPYTWQRQGFDQQ